jgi:hypothetical protein
VRKVTSRVLGRVGALATVAAIGIVVATPAHAASNEDVNTPLTTRYLTGDSTTGNSRMSGYYTYYPDGTAGGRTKYDGGFNSVTLIDLKDGNYVGAALVLEYDEWKNGAWRHVNPYISRTGSDGTTSWSFNDKANISIWVCDYYGDPDDNFFEFCRRPA